jgi:hypothetical protein
MTLAECGVADFSNFETFDNYCVAMFSFEYLHSHFMSAGGLVDLALRSPSFLDPLRPETTFFGSRALTVSDSTKRATKRKS